MPDTKKLLVVVDSTEEVVAVADVFSPNKHGISVEIRPREGQKIHEIEAPIEVTKLRGQHLKKAVSEVLKVPGAAKAHSPIHPRKRTRN